MNVEQLYRKYELRLRRKVRARFPSCPIEVVEDACQHAWLEAWRRRRPVNFSWLYLVACFEALDLLGEKTVPLFLTEDGRDMDDTIAARELLRTVASLGPNQRMAVSDRLAGFSYHECMERRGKTYTWVNRHVREGRAAVRERLAA